MTNTRRPRIAVLGAGLMGSASALFLARAGCSVTLYDRAAAPMGGASRWNEGKIHLGFLYSADRSLRTAQEVLLGGLSFKRLIEDLIGAAIDPAVTPEDDIYLVHPDSVVDAEAMGAYFGRVAELIRDHPHDSYLAPIAPVHTLSAGERERFAHSAIKAGFRVPERSVNTHWLADRIVDSLAAEPAIELRMRHAVERIDPADGSWNGPWRVRSDAGDRDEYDAVINALWEGRLHIDTRLGLAARPGWSHRYRLALFVRTAQPVDTPSAVLAAGPFGDVKNYDRRHFYLSWYPAGLVAEGGDVAPPEVRLPSPQSVIDATRESLTMWIPSTCAIFDQAVEIDVGGGWVFAQGHGSLTDPSASVHRRDSFGIAQHGTYFSVDTGKYSSAPWLAQRVRERIVGG